MYVSSFILGTILALGSLLEFKVLEALLESKVLGALVVN